MPARDARTCERDVYRHGAILLIVREQWFYSLAISTTWKLMSRTENRWTVREKYHPGQNDYRYRSEIKSKTIGL